jgi:4-hydroxyacetophenone monooxygenase
VPAPTGDALLELIELAVGEPVPPEYEAMAAEDMGFTVPKAPVAPPSDFRVVVIGAGVSGMLAAIRLAEAGIDHVVLEKNADVGGTWLENAYPGAGVDTPSHLYSYSFAPRRWSTHFGKRDEVLTYLRDVADAHDLREVIRFGTEVASAVYRDQRWIVTTAAGETLTADAVITAVGQLNRPKIPPLPGLDAFRGPLFHSARWPADLDVTGKRVVVVGTGASAMQIVPAIAGEVAELTIFQRSPQWIAPNDEYFEPVTEAVHWLMEHVPYYHVWYRFRLAWTFNDRVHPSLLIDPDWAYPDRSLNVVNDGHRRYFTRYVEAQLAGREDLIAKSLPTYPPFGKRMLLDNGWFEAIKRPDVELVTAPVASFSAHAVQTTDGDSFEADVVVLCTGFEARNFLGEIDVRGRDGVPLREVWGEDDATAYLGMTVPGFPNLFIMYGPNTGLGAGGSYIFVAECEARYIVDLLVEMMGQGYGSVECRQGVHDQWVREVDEAHAEMVWSHPGMSTYYRNASGRIVTNLPWRVVDYWEMTREVELDDYRFQPAAERKASSA